MSKKLLPVALVLTCFVFLFQISCENNNEFDLYGVRECDTSNITWESKIEDLLAKNCSYCHKDGSLAKGVRHDSYAEELKLVNDGRLKGVINHLEGYSKMPKNRGKLPDCELRQLNIWIDNGAPEK